MKLYTVALFLMFSFGLQAQTYVRNFEAKANTRDVGSTTATKIVMGDVTQYDVQSEIKIKILFTITIEYKAQASYKGGKLISSSASVYINENLQSSVVTERVDDHYKIVSDKHETKLYEDITWSTAKMYFNEPVNVKSVYSESEGIMKNMVKTSDGKYRVKDPKNEDANTTYGYSSSQGVHDIEVVREHAPNLTLKHVRETKKVE